MKKRENLFQVLREFDIKWSGQQLRLPLVIFHSNRQLLPVDLRIGREDMHEWKAGGQGALGTFVPPCRPRRHGPRHEAFGTESRAEA